MSLGSILSGVGAIASGFGLGSKDEPKGPDIHVQYKENLLHEMNMFNQKMKLAEHHGLHPLSVLGVPTGNFSPTVYVGGGGRDRDFGQIARGAGQIANAMVEPPEQPVDPYAERERDARLRILEADAKKAEWEALGTEWRVADYASPRLLAGQPGNPPGVRISNDAVEIQRLAAEQSGLSPSLFSRPDVKLEQSVLPPHPSKLGHGAATEQAHLSVIGADGKIASLLNQNAIQAEFEQGATMTWLVNRFGVERATEIMAAIEQKGILAGMGVAGAAAYKLWRDRMAEQRRKALDRRQFPGRGRGSWKARGGRGGGD